MTLLPTRPNCRCDLQVQVQVLAAAMIRAPMQALSYAYAQAPQRISCQGGKGGSGGSADTTGAGIGSRHKLGSKDVWAAPGPPTPSAQQPKSAPTVPQDIPSQPGSRRSTHSTVCSGSLEHGGQPEPGNALAPRPQEVVPAQGRLGHTREAAAAPVILGPPRAAAHAQAAMRCEESALSARPAQRQGPAHPAPAPAPAPVSWQQRAAGANARPQGPVLGSSSNTPFTAVNAWRSSKPSAGPHPQPAPQPPPPWPQPTYAFAAPGAPPQRGPLEARVHARGADAWAQMHARPSTAGQQQQQQQVATTTAAAAAPYAGPRGAHPAPAARAVDTAPRAAAGPHAPGCGYVPPRPWGLADSQAAAAVAAPGHGSGRMGTGGGAAVSGTSSAASGTVPPAPEMGVEDVLRHVRSLTQPQNAAEAKVRFACCADASPAPPPILPCPPLPCPPLPCPPLPCPALPCA